MPSLVGSEMCIRDRLKNVSCEYDRLNGWNSTLVDYLDRDLSAGQSLISIRYHQQLQRQEEYPRESQRRASIGHVYSSSMSLFFLSCPRERPSRKAACIMWNGHNCGKKVVPLMGRRWRCTHYVMHGRSRLTIDPRIPTMPVSYTHLTLPTILRV